MRGIAFVPKLTKKRYWLPLDPLNDRFNRSSAPELEICHEPCNDNSVSDSCLRLLDNRVLGKSWLDYGCERVIAKLSAWRIMTNVFELCNREKSKLGSVYLPFLFSFRFRLTNTRHRSLFHNWFKRIFRYILCYFPSISKNSLENGIYVHVYIWLMENLV